MRVSENGKRLCALYCRIGGVSEMDREMLEHQCWTLQTFAHKEGFEIAGSISALETGLLSHRPSIDDLVKICMQKHIKFLVVENLSRLCRGPEQCKKILQRLHESGVQEVITRKEGTIYLNNIF